METYTSGLNEDHIIKTESIDHDLDLTFYIKRFNNIKANLQSIPKKKTVPDQETLDHWTSTIYEEGQMNKILLNEKVIRLYNQIKLIKDVGLLPSKYDEEYQQLETYVNSL